MGHLWQTSFSRNPKRYLNIIQYFVEATREGGGGVECAILAVRGSTVLALREASYAQGLGSLKHPHRR